MFPLFRPQTEDSSEYQTFIIRVWKGKRTCEIWDIFGLGFVSPFKTSQKQRFWMLFNDNHLTDLGHLNTGLHWNSDPTVKLIQ